jgi:hypothetical protein
MLEDMCVLCHAWACHASIRLDGNLWWSAFILNTLKCIGELTMFGGNCMLVSNVSLQIKGI